MNSDYLKNVFRWLHIVWAVIGVGLCVLLATSKGGHPPAIILLPFAVVIWVIGHVVLWLSRKLAIRGKNLAERRAGESGKWPLILMLLALVTGVTFIAGLFGIFWLFFYENAQLNEIWVLLAFWVPISLCFFGILLRQNWTRFLAGGGCIVAALALVYQMIESVMRDYHHPKTEWLMSLVILALLLLFGLYLLRSSKIKMFLTK